MRFTNVALKSLGRHDGVADFNLSHGLYLTGCDLYAGDNGMPGTFLGASSQIFVDHCNFYGAYDVESMLYEWGAHDLSITNCTAQDYDNTKDWGWCSGRFFSGNGIWGTSRNTYIGDNTTHQLAVRPGAQEQNAGEQIMWEGNNVPIFQGSPTSGDPRTR